MNDHLQILPATRGDVPLILALIRELAEYERLAQQVVATEQNLAQFLFGDRPCAEVIIARYDGEPAGYALYFYSFSSFLARPGIYLEDLYVRPPLRGKGIGKSLLSHLARLAEQRGCGRLEWAVLNWNTPSIGFYESLGARPMDTWTVYRLTGDSLDNLANQTPRRR